MSYITVIVFFFIAMFSMGYFIVQWGKIQLRNDLEYEAMYDAVKSEMDDLDKTRENYLYLKNQIVKLSKLKGNDRDKTTELMHSLIRHFENVILPKNQKKIA